MDATARALSEPHRRKILQLIHDDECTVGAIAEQLPISRPAVSQHLRVLEDAELVTFRQEGTRRLYRSRPEGLLEMRDWLNQFWADGIDQQKVQVERDQWIARKNERRNRQATLP
jgi:DNA-binding transcriptional ArsR family regulator